MPSFKRNDEEPENEYPGEYSITKTISDHTGGTVEVTYHQNGHSTVHWGGPCGDQEYDEQGEEC